MSELIRMPSNIYEALLLELFPLIHETWTYDQINTSSSWDYYDYTDTKRDLRNTLSQLHHYIVELNEYVIDYFESIYGRIKAAPMGLQTDVEYGLPMHKVFECLVAAEVSGFVVGGKNDQGIDVMDPYRNNIIQCKSGESHSLNAKKIYMKLIESCINKNIQHGILAVTDEQFPPFDNYSDLVNLAKANNLEIELKLWMNYGITHPSSVYQTRTTFDNIFEEFESNFKVLSTFIMQVKSCVGKARRIHWNDILEQCINDINNAPNRFDDIQSSIYDNLSSLEFAYEDDDSVEPWEKAYMEGSNRSNSDSEDTATATDDDSEDVM